MHHVRTNIIDGIDHVVCCPKKLVTCSLVDQQRIIAMAHDKRAHKILQGENFIQEYLTGTVPIHYQIGLSNSYFGGRENVIKYFRNLLRHIIKLLTLLYPIVRVCKAAIY